MKQISLITSKRVFISRLEILSDLAIAQNRNFFARMDLRYTLYELIDEIKYTIVYSTIDAVRDARLTSIMKKYS